MLRYNKYNIYNYFSDDSNPESKDDNQDISYNDLLKKITKDWVNLEIDHRVSKKASNAFWLLAKSTFPKLHRARIQAMHYKPIPQLPTLRDKLYDTYVPPVKLNIGYQNVESNEITEIESSKTPLSQFDRVQYKKIYEVATVQVNLKRNDKNISTAIL